MGDKLAALRPMYNCSISSEAASPSLDSVTADSPCSSFCSMQLSCEREVSWGF
uniref:Uncharacterized protein n=1 Tax=Anguilla anguilla TaxID=7936 RepID=A0A0E9XDK7_ANGAN